MNFFTTKTFLNRSLNVNKDYHRWRREWIMDLWSMTPVRVQFANSRAHTTYNNSNKQAIFLMTFSLFWTRAQTSCNAKENCLYIYLQRYFANEKMKHLHGMSIWALISASYTSKCIEYYFFFNSLRYFFIRSNSIIGTMAGVQWIFTDSSERRQWVESTQSFHKFLKHLVVFCWCYCDSHSSLLRCVIVKKCNGFFHHSTLVRNCRILFTHLDSHCHASSGNRKKLHKFVIKSS